MFAVRTCVLLLVLSSITIGEITTSAFPTITISYPLKGSVLIQNPVNITGTAAGSDASWSQSTQADFDTGAMDNIIFNSSSGLQLDWGLYDDFNDNTLDTARWLPVEHGGQTVTEDGGMLYMSGSYLETGFWNSYCWAYSMRKALRMCSADLMSFSGSGSGYSTFLMLYEDKDNYINIGRIVDTGAFGTNTPQLHWIYSIDGVRTVTKIGDVKAGIHTYSIEYANGNACLFEDNNLIASKDLILVNAQMALFASLRKFPDVEDVQWDNAKIDFAQNGIYTSKIFDTSSVDPVLKGINWTADTPAGTSIMVQIRSSKKYDMTAPTPWTQVNRSQIQNLPALKQFIQYRINFNSTDGQNTPKLKNITIDYHKPVNKVEISVDNQATWLMAHGTENWYISLEIPETTTMVWARATDVAGNISLASVTIKMDTTPIALEAIINDGNKYTASRDVNLTLSVEARNPIDRVMVSEFGDFSDSSWMGYNDIIPFTLSEGEGQKIVFVKVADIHGLESSAANATIELVITLPKGSILIEDGAEYTGNTTVSLSLTATAKAGVSEMLISNRADFIGARWAPYQSILSWNLLPGDGERTVYAAFRDLIGLVSAVTSDTITLDTTPPAIQATINGGLAYTRTTGIDLSLQATDNYYVTSMQLSENSSFPGASWTPFVENTAWTLTGGDGQKVVYVRAMDVAGNIGKTTSASIVLDTTPPSSFMDQLPFTVTDVNFTVRWAGNDATSGIRSFDVQYRDGANSWADWLTQINATSAVFNGRDNHTYSFRVRAQDLAGNLEKMADIAGGSVRVRVPVPRLPTVTIVRPAADATISGSIQILGTATHPEPGMKITQVQVQIDNGEWRTAKGTDSWSFNIDTTKLGNGDHLIKVKAFDGKRYSDINQVMVYVDNKPTGIGQIFESPMTVVIFIIIIIVSLAVAVLFSKRKKPIPLGLSKIDKNPVEFSGKDSLPEIPPPEP